MNLGSAAGFLSRRVSGLAHFAMNHPKTIVGTAITAGIVSQHPLRKMSQAAGAGFTGNPDYIRQVVTGGIIGQYGSAFQGDQPGFGANILTTGNTAGITTQNREYSVNPNPDQALRMNEQSGPNPDGSIVFGLYNRRLI